MILFMSIQNETILEICNSDNNETKLIIRIIFSLLFVITCDFFRKVSNTKVGQTVHYKLHNFKS